MFDCQLRFMEYYANYYVIYCTLIRIIIELIYQNVKQINHHVWDRFKHGL